MWLYEFLSGALAITCLVIGLFFWQFYRKVQDRFFLLFAGAFGLFAMERVCLMLFRVRDEGHSLIYLVRLVGFFMILCAIVDKNRVKQKAG